MPLLQPRYDILIVGAGLAGVFSAFHLSQHGSIAVLELGGVGSGASGVAAGLVNPMMGRRARPIWRAEAALEAFGALVQHTDATPFLHGDGVLRPAWDAQQADWFIQAAAAHPSLGQWFGPQQAMERFPSVKAPLGALWVRRGAAVDVSGLLRQVLAQAPQLAVHLGVRVTGWSVEGDEVHVDVSKSGMPGKVAAKRLLLCVGAGIEELPLGPLDLHRVKGQVIRTTRPSSLAGSHPAVAGQGYLAPMRDHLVIGSTYEHHYAHLHPDPAKGQALLDRAAGMVPAAADTQVIGMAVGVRVNVPGTRLPMLGPLPGTPRVWIFSGLGSKGLLMAALLAPELPAYLRNPEAIPPEVAVRLKQ